MDEKVKDVFAVGQHRVVIVLEDGDIVLVEDTFRKTLAKKSIKSEE